MRKIVVTEFITLDGVVQGAGGPEKGFEKYGGWSTPYYDEALDEIAEQQKKPAKDFLLGRKTYEIFASFFPTEQGQQVWPGNNDITKYVTSKTLKKADLPAGRQGWKNTVILKDIDDIKKLKDSEGSDLQVSGSGALIQTLLKHDLVDELWLLIHPLTLGTGNKLFEDGTIPAAFKLIETKATPSGVIVAHYTRAGDVKTASMGA
jgi:dihydrofolate reductase